MDELGIHVFEIGEDEKLLKAGVVAHIAVLARIAFAPFAGSLTKEGHIEKVGLFRVGEDSLFRSDFLRDEVGLDRVSVDAVVDLGERAVEIPGKRKTPIFILFETLEFLDQVELEFDRNPGREFESHI